MKGEESRKGGERRRNTYHHCRESKEYQNHWQQKYHLYWQAMAQSEKRVQNANPKHRNLNRRWMRLSAYQGHDHRQLRTE